VERAVVEARTLKEDLRRKAVDAARPVQQPLRRSTRRAPTEFKPFSFATDVRAAQRAQRPEAELPPPHFMFGGAGGPVTRNRVRVTTTAAPQAPQVDSPASGGSGSSGGSGRGLGLRARRTTAGPMMLGGARRVLRSDQGDSSEGEGAAPEGYDAAAEPDGMQAIIRAGAGADERTTLHNPLFNNNN
jgi:hypothetical protein